jgi:hypothetical protein
VKAPNRQYVTPNLKAELMGNGRYIALIAVGFSVVGCGPSPVGKYSFHSQDHDSDIAIYPDKSFVHQLHYNVDDGRYSAHTVILKGHWENFEQASYILTDDSLRSVGGTYEPHSLKWLRAKFESVGNGGDLEVTDGSPDFDKGEHFTKTATDPDAR